MAESLNAEQTQDWFKHFLRPCKRDPIYSTLMNYFLAEFIISGCCRSAVHVHESWDEFHAFFEEVRRRRGGRLIAFSKFGSRHHATEGTYQAGDWLLFGAETTGLPEQVAHGEPQPHVHVALTGAATTAEWQY